MFPISLECVKITSLGLKFNGPELLFVVHNRSENSNVVAGLPAPMGYDCIYDSTCDSSSHFDFE